MDALFELLGRMTNAVQPLLQQGELSAALLAMVALAGVIAGLTPFGLSTMVLVTGRVTATGAPDRATVLRHALWFCLGSATSLLAAGLAAVAAGTILLDYRLAPYVPLITLLMGLHLLIGTRLHLLSRVRLPRARASRQSRHPGAVGTFLLGLPFGLAVLLVFITGRSAPLVVGCAYGHTALQRFARGRRTVVLRRILGTVIVAASAYILTIGRGYLGG